MKKVGLTLIMIFVLICGTVSFATNDNSDNINDYATYSEEKSIEEVTPATEKILDNMTKKEKKIAEYTDKYNDSFNGNVAYYLDLAQLYSIPICIIGIAIGAFNYYIIGEKKLDKKEQGFGFIMAFVCGLVFFQVLPFVFALLVAGK